MSPERVSAGIKTSQSNLTYDEILKTWLEAEDVPVFQHAWLWDHFIPLRGPVRPDLPVPRWSWTGAA